MGETVDGAPTASRPRPTILVPPRGSMEFLFAHGSGPGFSPGPMTLVSSLFPEKSPFSFSQLLAGAMASPLAAKPGLLPASEISEQKWNKPMNSARQLESLNPLFVVPPGLSPSGLLNSPGFLSPLLSPFGMSHQQALAHVTAQAAMSQSFKKMQSELQHEPLTNQSSAETLTQQTNPLPLESENSKMESSEVLESDKKTASVGGDKPASDGYNWRKYGQKHVKASECPRSYYKCTHINCPVKKKVERSSDGRISEITYKGQHNHDPPQLNKRGKDGCAPDKTINSHVKPVFSSQVQNEANRPQINEGVPVLPEHENFQATTRESFEHHPVDSHNDDMEDNVIVVDEDDDGQPVPKRRSMEIGPSVPALSHQTASDSKIVLQTRSEVDLLDDGYKWRKYGQKVVKGNPHPRSYYRCTFSGCNVRKHVERSSTDPKAVITTYEGKHNHDIPTGRNSSHGTANTGSYQKRVSKNPSQNKEIDYGNTDQIPMTLQLKEEQIAA